jgi:TRAP-type mannitol/chloroaromatic compound transport system permease small subunit
VPIYQLKSVIVAAGLLLLVQGVAQVCRCILCMRTGEWLAPEGDVRETDEILIEAAAQGKDVRRMVD